MGQLTKYQTVSATNWKGLTTNNHLGAIFQRQAQPVTNLMVQLLAYNRGKSMEAYLSQFPTKEFETDDELTWNAIGSSRRNIALIEARDENGNIITSGNAGVSGAPFYLVFAEDWWADGNVIVGEKNEAYLLRILGEARLEGTNAVYKVELMGGNRTGMPSEELMSGKKFSVEYSPVESEMSRGVGDIRFTSHISLRNEWSTIRIRHKVSGAMLNKKLLVGVPVKDKNSGKTIVHDMWMHHVEYKLEETFSDEKNHLLMFGRSNRDANGEYSNYGKSGNVIKMGAGLREQMEYSNITYYNKFSLKLIEDALYELSAAKLDMGDRLFILRTGERGAAQFHKEVLQTISGWTQFIIDNSSINIVEKTQSKMHTNSLTAGFQFTEFKAPNGVRLKVEIDPFYDDPIRNKIQHPNGGPAESYRYDILYIGTMDQPNIQMARIKGNPEYRGYKWGLVNPFTGQTSNGNMSYDEDSAEIHRKWTGAVIVLDSTRTMSIIPSILR